MEDIGHKFSLVDEGARYGYKNIIGAGYTESMFSHSPDKWLTPDELRKIDGLAFNLGVLSGYSNHVILNWIFFPRGIKLKSAIFMFYKNVLQFTIPLIHSSFHASSNTTNGSDGDWHPISILSSPIERSNQSSSSSIWFLDPAKVSSPLDNLEGIKAIRFAFLPQASAGPLNVNFSNIYLSGNYVEELEHEILILKGDNETEELNPIDFATIQEEASKTVPLYIKNNSQTKVASNINLSFTGISPQHLSVSINDGSSFSTTENITQLLPGESKKILVRLFGGMIPQPLGRKFNELKINVGSWN